MLVAWKNVLSVKDSVADTEEYVAVIETDDGYAYMASIIIVDYSNDLLEITFKLTESRRSKIDVFTSLDYETQDVILNAVMKRIKKAFLQYDPVEAAIRIPYSRGSDRDHRRMIQNKLGREYRVDGASQEGEYNIFEVSKSI